MDMLMPILDGESAARMIKSTNNANQATPIVAVTSYELSSPDCPLDEQNTMFSAVSRIPLSLLIEGQTRADHAKARIQRRRGGRAEEAGLPNP
jgi:CheY-like chemotaxis protein